MISISFVDKGTGPFFLMLGESVSWLGNQSYTWDPYLMSISPAYDSETYTVDAGVLIQDREAWGDLRDKGVTHTRIDADLSLDYGLTSCNEPFTGILTWGVPYTFAYSYTWNSVVQGGDTYRCDGGSIMHQSYFNGDYLVDVRIWSNAATYVNNSLSANASQQITMTCFRRHVDHVERVGQTTLSSSPSMEAITAFMASCIGLSGTNVPAATGVTSSPLPDDPDDVISDIVDQIIGFDGFSSLIADEPVDFGELAVECAEQLDYLDANVLSLAFDIRDWRNFHAMWKNIANKDGWKTSTRLFKRLCKGRLKNPHDFVRMLKPSASSYLLEKYALETCLRDLDTVVKGCAEFIQQPLYRRLHSRRVVPLDPLNATFRRYTAVLTVEVGLYPNGFTGKLQELIGNMKRWGIYPQASNLYDMLPYSFVVDWFVQYGDLVKQCDTFLDQKNYFPVKYCIQSSKWEAGFNSTEILPDNVPVTGQVVYSHYRRWITRAVPLPDVNLSVGSGALQKHSVETAALILQRV